MRIAYLTLDDVHEVVAAQMAAEYDIELRTWWPKDGPPDGACSAQLYDLDYWPLPERRQVLSDLLAGRLPGPVGVHGYNLDDEQMEALAKRGVIVGRYLEPELLARLYLAALEGRVAAAQEALPAHQGRPAPVAALPA